MEDRVAVVRRATADDAAVVARLLDEFNREFDTPTPGAEVLAARLRELLGTESTFAYLAGDPAVAVALLTRRPNVWYAGPVDLLDELYVAPAHRDRGIGGAIIARLLEDARRDGVALVEINVDEADVDTQRFYARHGFAGRGDGDDERAVYFWRELHE